MRFFSGISFGRVRTGAGAMCAELPRSIAVGVVLILLASHANAEEFEFVRGVKNSCTQPIPDHLNDAIQAAFDAREASDARTLPIAKQAEAELGAKRELRDAARSRYYDCTGSDEHCRALWREYERAENEYEAGIRPERLAWETYWEASERTWREGMINSLVRAGYDRGFAERAFREIQEAWAEDRFDNLHYLLALHRCSASFDCFGRGAAAARTSALEWHGAIGHHILDHEWDQVLSFARSSFLNSLSRSGFGEVAEDAFDAGIATGGEEGDEWYRSNYGDVEDVLDGYCAARLTPADLGIVEDGADATSCVRGAVAASLEAYRSLARSADGEGKLAFIDSLARSGFEERAADAYDAGLVGYRQYWDEPGRAADGGTETQALAPAFRGVVGVLCAASEPAVGTHAAPASRPNLKTLAADARLAVKPSVPAASPEVRAATLADAVAVAFDKEPVLAGAVTAAARLSGAVARFDPAAALAAAGEFATSLSVAYSDPDLGELGLALTAAASLVAGDLEALGKALVAISATAAAEKDEDTAVLAYTAALIALALAEGQERPATGQAVAVQADSPSSTTPAGALTGQELREAQTLLAALGYEPGPADGIWGARSIRAYQAFLRDAELPVTGELTPAALHAMRRLLDRRQE